MLKKTFALFFAIMFIISSLGCVYAVEGENHVCSENITVIGIGIDDQEIDPQYIGTCSNGGKHLMFGRGIGWAYYGEVGNAELRFTGCASQCKYCDLVLITEGNPFVTGSTWGNYALWNPGYQCTNNVVMYTRDFGYSNSVSDEYVLGFEFAK